MDDKLAAWLETAQVPREELVSRLYRLVLRREPEAGARERTLGKLAEGTLSPATLLRELVESEESRRVGTLDDALAFARWARSAGERPRELRGPPGSDERVIEIPWVLSRLRAERRVLDVGYAFAEPAYLAGLVAAVSGELVGVDLAEAEVPGLRSVVGDLRQLPFRARSFDVALCVSTLEHIGRDNTVYGLEAERDESGMVRALRELRGVLGGGGRLLVSVPCGEPEEHDWFVQRDEAGWLQLFREGGFLTFEHEVYELGDAGWVSTPAFEATGVRYGERGPAASAVLCAELHPARLRERARSASRALRRLQ